MLDKIKSLAIVPKHMDFWLLGSTLCLIALGIVMIYSSSVGVAAQRFQDSSFFLVRQIIRVGITLSAFYLAYRCDYHHWSRWCRPLLYIAIVLLAYLVIAGGVRQLNGAKRWIGFAFGSFQPADLARLALVIFTADRMSKLKDRKGNFWAGFLPALAYLGLVCLLVIKQPNFSTAVIIGIITFILYFVGGVPKRHLSALVALALAAGVFFMLSAPYRRARVMAFMHQGNSQTQAVNYQAQQSLLSLGSGGLFGVGLGQSQQKYFFLPEPFTDFVASIIGEELGFAGLTMVLLLFIIIWWRGFRIALRAPDRFGFLLAVGIGTMIMLQAALHLGVCSSVLPTTGVPLPFLSYGGSSLLFSCMGIGILMNIYSQKDRTINAKEETVQGTSNIVPRKKR
jgi:cell division protein FtsW